MYLQTIINNPKDHPLSKEYFKFEEFHCFPHVKIMLSISFELLPPNLKESLLFDFDGIKRTIFHSCQSSLLDFHVPFLFSSPVVVNESQIGLQSLVGPISVRQAKIRRRK